MFHTWDPLDNFHLAFNYISIGQGAKFISSQESAFKALENPPHRYVCLLCESIIRGTLALISKPAGWFCKTQNLKVWNPQQLTWFGIIRWNRHSSLLLVLSRGIVAHSLTLIFSTYTTHEIPGSCLFKSLFSSSLLLLHPRTLCSQRIFPCLRMQCCLFNSNVILVGKNRLWAFRESS